MLRQKPKVQWQRHSTAKCLEQARRHEAIILFSKNQLGNFVKSSIDDISVVTLKRTDTTLDLSQKAKRSYKRRKFKRKGGRTPTVWKTTLGKKKWARASFYSFPVLPKCQCEYPKREVWTRA